MPFAIGVDERVAREVFSRSARKGFPSPESTAPSAAGGAVTAPRDSMGSSRGAITAPPAPRDSPRGAIIAPRGVTRSSQGAVAAPRSMTESSRGAVVAPRSVQGESRGAAVAPCGDKLADRGAVIAPSRTAAFGVLPRPASASLTFPVGSINFATTANEPWPAGPASSRCGSLPLREKPRPQLGHAKGAIPDLMTEIGVLRVVDLGATSGLASTPPAYTQRSGD
jgi:hypothetical protein